MMRGVTCEVPPMEIHPGEVKGNRAAGGEMLPVRPADRVHGKRDIRQ